MRMVRFGYGDEEENTDRQRDGIEEMERDDSRAAGKEYTEGYECGAEEASGDAEGETLRTGAECRQETMGEGWIYFIETADGKFVKIGFSMRPVRRLGQLGTLMPVNLLGCFPGSKTTERWLHWRFAANQQIGEWFKSTAALKRFVATVGITQPEPRKPRPVVESVVETVPDKFLPVGPKNPAAVALGKLGGKKGGKARMESMTPEERQEFARMGGEAGGKARTRKLTSEQRSEIARKAGLAGGRGRKKDQE